MDLDQSAAAKYLQRVYLGPSLGWIEVPGFTLNVSNSGLVLVSLGITLVRVNVNAAVTIQLPLAQGATPIPGTLAGFPITVIDVGGLAAANPITIQGTSPDLIDGLASVQITSNYGFFNFKPLIATGSYNLQ